METRLLRFAILLVAASGSSAQAAVITYRGNTTSQPTFNRPLEDFSTLSSVGTATRYDTRTFSVSQSGTYDFTSAAAFDSFFALYRPSFNPAMPLSNGLIANDDHVGFSSSGFAASLVAGSSYVAVMTAFANTDFGAYAVSIGGAGEFTPVASSGPSSDVFVLSADTTGKPTYNRPLEDLSGLSAVGTATVYDTFGFTVNVSGAYDLTSSAAFDTFLTLYQSSFNPDASLTNVLIADDDLVGLNSAGFAVALTAGMPYFAVTSGFANTDAGAYALMIAGAGQVTLTNPFPPITAVPEPSTWAIMLGGLGLMDGMLRRRSAMIS